VAPLLVLAVVEDEEQRVLEDEMLVEGDAGMEDSEVLEVVEVMEEVVMGIVGLVCAPCCIRS
jgi:hypothetical protein